MLKRRGTLCALTLTLVGRAFALQFGDIPASTDVSTLWAEPFVADSPLSLSGGHLSVDLSAYQPIDPDLTAIAALSGTNTIYYRSGAATWTSVTIGGNMTFSGGVLNSTVSGGTPGGSNTQVQFNDSSAFGGDVDFTWDKTTNLLTLAGTETISLSDAATNTTTTLLTFGHNSSGTAAANLGTKILFKAEDASGNDSDQGYITSQWSVVTAGSQTAYMDFGLRATVAGNQSAMRLFQHSGSVGGLSVGSTTDPGSGIVNANGGYWVGNATSTSGKILKSNGSAFLASTETYAAPGTSGNVLTSDGTNWTSAAAPGGASMTFRGNSDYTILSTDRTVVTNAAFTAPRTWTLPTATAVSAGVAITVADLAGAISGGNLTIATVGSDRMHPGNASTYILSISGMALTLVSDGVSKWVTYAVQPGQITGSGQFMQGISSVWRRSDYTLPTTASSSGKLAQSDGTNIVMSTPTWPVSVGTSGNQVVSDGTNFVSLTKVATPLSTSDTTVNNQQTPTTGGVTLASQTLASGTMWWIRAFGDYTNANSATARNLEMQPNWGGTNLTKVVLPIKVSVASSTTSWQCDLLIVGTGTTSAWVSGTAAGQVSQTLGTTFATATSASNTSLSSGAQTLDFRVDTSASVVGDSIVVKGVIMQRLK